MGHHDDTHDNIHRALRPFEPDDYPGAGAGAGAPPHQYEDPDDVPIQVYRLVNERLISDFVHTFDKSKFTATEWESRHSSIVSKAVWAPDDIFGTGSVSVDDERHTRSGYTPVIDDRNEVVAHLGWAPGYAIYVPVNTIGRIYPDPFAEANLKAILKTGSERAQGGHPAAPAARRPPRPHTPVVAVGVPIGLRLENGEVERASMYSAILSRKRLEARNKHDEAAKMQKEAVNSWLALGGHAFVGAAGSINARTFDRCFTTDQRCLVLVKPDGQLACLLKVEPASYLSLAERVIYVAKLVGEMWLTSFAIGKIAAAIYRVAAATAEIRALQVILRSRAAVRDVVAERTAVGAGRITGPVTAEQMETYLQDVVANRPELAKLMRAAASDGAELTKQTLQALEDWQYLHGRNVRWVENGVVQRLEGSAPGNYLSLRPNGELWIERQVSNGTRDLQNHFKSVGGRWDSVTATLEEGTTGAKFFHRQVTHELVADALVGKGGKFTGQDLAFVGQSFRRTNNALFLLENAIQMGSLRPVLQGLQGLR